jgi:hypothetical protein
MKAIVIVIFLVPLLFELQGQLLHERWSKTWKFNSRGKDLTIELKVGLPGRQQASSMTISSEGTSGPGLAEEIMLVGQVIQEMPSLGANPRELVAMHLFIQEPDVRARLAIAAAQSEKWRSAIKTKSGGGDVVAEILNKLGAYNAFNDVLRDYGLEVANVGGVEEILTDKLGNVDSINVPKGIERSTIVPTGASIDIALRKKQGR